MGWEWVWAGSIQREGRWQEGDQKGAVSDSESSEKAIAKPTDGLIYDRIVRTLPRTPPYTRNRRREAITGIRLVPRGPSCGVSVAAGAVEGAVQEGLCRVQEHRLPEQCTVVRPGAPQTEGRGHNGQACSRLAIKTRSPFFTLHLFLFLWRKKSQTNFSNQNRCDFGTHVARHWLKPMGQCAHRDPLGTRGRGGGIGQRGGIGQSAFIPRVWVP